MGAPIVVCSDCGLDWALHDTNPEGGELRHCQPDICLRLLRAVNACLRADLPGTQPCCGAPEHRVVDLMGAASFDFPDSDCATHLGHEQEEHGVQS